MGYTKGTSVTTTDEAACENAAPKVRTQKLIPEGVSTSNSPSGKELISMTKDTDTNDYEERNVLKGFPEKMAHAFIKKVERALCQFMPPSHGNSLYTKEDFAKQLVFIACHGDFISNGSCVYNLEHSGSSGDTILHHLHNLSMEDVQCLYEKANKYRR